MASENTAHEPDSWPHWVLRRVPDPFTDLTYYLDRSRNEKQVRWASSVQRRSKILATARLLMSQHAFDKVKLQSLAEDCGVSIQTIYNLIGNREQMLHASAAQWVYAIAADGRKLAGDSDFNSTFTMLAMFWSSAFVHRDYVRSAAHFTVYEGAPLRQPFYAAGNAVFLEDLTRLDELGMVRAGVDLKCLARQLNVSANSTICQWVIEQDDTNEFGRELLNGPGLMLAGALKGEEAARLERTMRWWGSSL